MAEKDESEGRCPACRTTYQKEKVVRMQTNIERAGNNNANRKSKQQPKAKTKTNEVKKDLTNVRVIQRKMAYVIGLPLSLADEDLLQRKEYFGQYGKVSKISLSRTTGGAIQQFVNDTCSVYITYSKEEEAVRCIQSVHGFVLEGRYLRASFGTAKYCHAWLRNTPCSNPSCLYLHSIGADEDSFGKDDVAAIHTRNRVQQIVGVASSMMNRSGDVLPPPIDELSSTSVTSTETSSIRNAVNDAANDTGNYSSYMAHVIPHDKDGDAGGPNRITTFVDIVGRPNTSDIERDGNRTEDFRILNLSSDLSSVTISKDNHGHETYTDKTLFKVPSSNHVCNHLQSNQNEPFREDYTSFDSQGPKDSNNMDHKAFLMSSCSAQSTENSGGRLLVHRSCSPSSNGMDYGALHNQVDQASLPLSCVNTILNEGFHDLKFQSSVKSDRVYRSSTSFSNEEIVEHLRRIDGDNLTNYQDSSFNAVESSIVSNIMSMDLDSCDDSMALRRSFAGSYGESVGKHGASWNSLHSDQSGFPFVKQDDFSRQGGDLESSFRNIGQISKNSSILQDFRENKEQYVHKAPYQITRPKVSAPPGFSMPPRDPLHSFASSDEIGGIPLAVSGSRLVNSSSSNLLHTPSTGSISSAGDIDFVDLASSGFGNGKPTNGFDISALEIGSACVPQRRGFEDEARIWHLMQQKSLDQGKYSQVIAAPQTPSVHQSRRFASHGGDEYFGLDDIYGFSSRVVDQHQSFNSSSYSQFPQHKLAPNGQIFNGFQHNSLDEIRRSNEVDSMTQLQTNETLGFKKFYAGYGDHLMFQAPRSGDVYTRVFGM
ncbi:CCR4-NOT transcription complex subunit 4 [Datura stramonium]|uniref:CCR4-NOT transcription complex subunit 4 n=1 Tax=Datura stramonium TaxID=4076 RepID=A0ABS8RT96_DATST|nr:CCR4-NOT transcription complex subunit 4 [Datura stramonium]